MKHALYPSRFKPFIAVIVIVGLAPLFFGSSYMLSLFILTGIYGMITIGLSLLMGYAGQISIGHAAFFGIGAYVSGVLTTAYQVSPWIAMFAGILITALLSYIIGVPILKLKEHFLAFATVGINVIVFIVLLGMVGVTKGAAGLSGIPKLSLFGFTLSSDLSYYYFVWALVLLIALFAINIVYSHVGRVLRGIHDSEIATQTQGVNVAKFKLHIFVLSAVFASIAGSLYAHFMNFLTPYTFFVLVSIQFLIMVFVGGSQSIWGALVGAFIMTMLGEWIKLVPMFTRAGSEIEIVVYGIILIVVVMFMPKGIVPTIAGFINRYRNKKDTPAEKGEDLDDIDYFANKKVD